MNKQKVAKAISAVTNPPIICIPLFLIICAVLSFENGTFNISKFAVLELISLIFTSALPLAIILLWAKRIGTDRDISNRSDRYMPLIIGKSFDQNNPLPSIPVLKSMNELLYEKSSFSNFEEFIHALIAKIEQQVFTVVHDIRFDVSPLYSLFFDDCLERCSDFSKGGAKYSYHGIQILSFPNLINALLNLKKFVFETHFYTLEECASALESNFQGYEEMLNVFHNNPLRFGSSNNEVVRLTNMLMHEISKITSKLTINGDKVKVGFSSAAYIQQCKSVGASLDGRKAGDPFAVHISPVSHAIDIQEVIDFAGNLDYGENRLNGNVVDFILPLSYIKTPDKLITILKSIIDKGVFELQLNVLNAAILKDAKAHPEKYPELIVRVWGFSAYFKDLPASYQDNLIKRASLYAAS